MSRSDYDGYTAESLLRRVRAIYGDTTYEQKRSSIKAGPDYSERMDEFYDWCYENEIIPL